MKFIGIDCVSAVDPNGKQHLLGVNLDGNVITFDNAEIIDQ